MLNSFIWLPVYLENRAFNLEIFKSNPIKTAEAALIRDLIPVVNEVRHLAIKEKRPISAGTTVDPLFDFRKRSVVRFLPEESGAFRLPGFATPRTAVTGDAVDSAIIFNLDRVSESDEFGWEQALRLLLHEIGHKYKARKAAKEGLGKAELDALQDRIDDLAAKIGAQFGGQAFSNFPLFALNATPFNAPGVSLSSPSIYYPARAPNRLWVLNKDRWFDVSESLYKDLDRLESRRNSVEIDRIVRNMQILEQWPGGIRATAEMVVYRHPKSTKQFSPSDLGGPHYYLAEFTVDMSSGPTPRLTALSYSPAQAPLGRAEDAEVDVPELTVNADRSFTGRLELTVTTEKNFHSAGYPSHRRGSLVLYASGKTVQVPIVMHAVIDNAWSGMPGEIHKKTMVKRARIEGQLPADWPSEFTIIGLVDTFYRLGLPAEYEPKLRLVTMKRPKTISAGCAPELHSTL